MGWMDLDVGEHHSCPEALLASRKKTNNFSALSGIWSRRGDSLGELLSVLGRFGHSLGSTHQADLLMSRGRNGGAEKGRKPELPH